MSNVDVSNTDVSNTDVSKSERWYVVKQSEGHCDIVASPKLDDPNSSNADEHPTQWGPFDSQGEAIARRVGLIRAGKCQPV